jgi:hypothetical protein
LTPICGYVRVLTSRAIWNVITRVMSACSASTWRSNISLQWSSQSAGTPVGRVKSGIALASCCSAFWMRRSTSRTVSR